MLCLLSLALLFYLHLYTYIDMRHRVDWKPWQWSCMFVNTVPSPRGCCSGRKAEDVLRDALVNSVATTSMIQFSSKQSLWQVNL